MGCGITSQLVPKATKPGLMKRCCPQPRESVIESRVDLKIDAEAPGRCGHKIRDPA
jgi:hypothetical protein